MSPSVFSVAETLEGRDGRDALQRFFSTFPGGKPGIGLLLLRTAVGITTISAGVVYFSGSSNPSLGKWSLGIVLITSGTAMTIGFLTPLSGLLVGATFLGIALAWFPVPPWSLLDAGPLTWGMIITAASIALLGPGTFSLDGRLFGRREIVIPPPSPGSES